MKNMTGAWIDHCPWKAHQDPFVGRVLRTLAFKETGFEFPEPNPSHRLVQGLASFMRIDNSIACTLMDLDTAKRKRGLAK